MQKWRLTFFRPCSIILSMRDWKKKVVFTILALLLTSLPGFSVAGAEECCRLYCPSSIDSMDHGSMDHGSRDGGVACPSYKKHLSGKEVQGTADILICFENVCIYETKGKANFFVSRSNLQPHDHTPLVRVSTATLLTAFTEPTDIRLQSHRPVAKIRAFILHSAFLI